MRILFDHQIMDAQVRGGVSRYYYELIATIQSQGLAEIRLPQVCTDNDYFRSSLAGPDFKSNGLRFRLLQRMIEVAPGKKAVRRAWRKAKCRLNEQASIEELKKQDFDLFHPTYYDPYFLDYLKGRPFVLTIYDMTHEAHPEYFGPKDRTREHKALLAGAAARIIAISAATRSDILRYLNVDPGKIEVVYLANSLAGGGEELAVPESYVLHVGERARYKNFRAFFLAFAGLASTRPDLHLVCVSQKDFSQAELDLMRGLGLEGRCVNIPANDAQLVFLYRNASLLVYPSLSEGFGLPILEAFASNCPVALSNASCFQEIAGEAAVYFDPSNVPAMERAVAEILSDDALRQALRRRGQERLKKFSWATTAEQTAALYEKCLAAE